MAQPLTVQAPYEFSAGGGLRQLSLPRFARLTCPTYATGQTQSTIHQVENFSITGGVPGIALGGTYTFTGTQGFSIMGNITLTPTDAGQIIFANVSASLTAGTGCVVSTPTLQIKARSTVAAGSLPLNGALTPGQSYGPMTITASAVIHAVAAYGGGTLTITGTAILLGSASSG